MTTNSFEVIRWSVVAKKPFDAVVASIEAEVGRPDLRDFQARLGTAKGIAELEDVIGDAAGKSGFIEFARFDLGAILRLESGAATPRILRLLIGNPLIMKELVKHVPEAGSYAPVTLLIDEQPDGVHLSYDQMASYLAPYLSAEASKVARELDAKVEGLLRTAAK